MQRSPSGKKEAEAWAVHPGAETHHRRKKERAAAQRATAAVTETPDYPESPQPPHLMGPTALPARPLAPLHQRTPQKILLDDPFYNNRSSAYAVMTPYSYPDSLIIRNDSLIPFITPILHILDS